MSRSITAAHRHNAHRLLSHCCVEQLLLYVVGSGLVVCDFLHCPGPPTQLLCEQSLLDNHFAILRSAVHWAQFTHNALVDETQLNRFRVITHTLWYMDRPGRN